MHFVKGIKHFGLTFSLYFLFVCGGILHNVLVCLHKKNKYCFLVSHVLTHQTLTHCFRWKAMDKCKQRRADFANRYSVMTINSNLLAQPSSIDFPTSIFTWRPSVLVGLNTPAQLGRCFDIVSYISLTANQHFFKHRKTFSMCVFYSFFLTSYFDSFLYDKHMTKKYRDYRNGC